MSDFHVEPSSILGTISAPPSKSHTMRALVFALMAKGTSKIWNYLPSTDTDQMIQAIEMLGAKIKKSANFIEVEGVDSKLMPASNVIDAGNSGLVLRFIGALSALLPTYTVITGDHSIRTQRIISPLLKGLQELGAFAESTKLDGQAPIIIKGPIKAGNILISGEDSQPVSALLIATSFLKDRSTINVTEAGEKPWIDLTISWLKKLGISIENQNYELYKVSANAHYVGFDVTIPGDFSSAAFAVGAALITNSEITIHNLDMNDCQGDKQLLYALQKMGAKIDINTDKNSVTVKKNSSLKGGKIDVNSFIDAVPILSVISCFAEAPVEIYNAKVARKKESDRLKVAALELKKMGAKIEEKSEGLIIYPSSLKSATVDSHQDHRMAFSLAVAGLAAKGKTIVKNVECTQKSYPNFFKDFKKLGAKLVEVLA